ncbi:MAG: M81 family metallopeptidase, partial [Erysipelotrichaceae bacterium]|nr:M81 family metallopeptidase [Erysipelotrichaceae bacterium]
MKILVGQFKTESNANVDLRNDITRYDIAFGDECLRKSKVRDVIESYGYEPIPAIYADTGPSYVIKKETFDYIETSMLNAVKAHLHEIDGIYLMLHGASYVEDIGSGDFHIVSEIRKITGPYLPIFVACDPHGNLSEEYCRNVTLIRCFRQSPHTDSDLTKRYVAKLLCEFLANRQNIRPVYHKLPLILGGEQSVSTDEPVKSINMYLDRLEEDPHIMSCSWHVGYLRHDCYEAGCGLVIIPSTEQDIPYCEQKIKELAQFVWDKRHEFHYTGLTMQPD